jgi:transposase
VAALQAKGLVFVDESGAHLQMTRRYGRCAAAARLVGQVPQGHYRTATVIAGVRRGGPSAPWIFEGALNGEMFLAWVQVGLVPTLRKGEVVVLDNLATHKVHGVRQSIEAVGARLEYLPPYSPDLNPIENMWSKIKENLRRDEPRTWRQLLRAAKVAFASVSATDCQGFFSHAGYAT